MKKNYSQEKNFRVFDEDIWGTLRLSNKVNKLSYIMLQIHERNLKKYKPFFFDVIDRPIEKRKRLSKYGLVLFNRKKICAYYGGLPLQEYRFLAKKAHIPGFYKNFELNLLHSLENSLGFLLYKTGFTFSVAEGHDLVKRGYIAVNKKIIKQPQFVVPPGAIVEIISIYKQKYFYKVLERLKKQQLLFVELPYIHISYSNMSFSVIQGEFSISKIFYPFNFSPTFFRAEYKSKY